MQESSYTPGVERALAAAARCGGANSSLGNAELLLGLLAESECRAATMLAACGVDLPSVQQRWPHLSLGSPPDITSAEDLSDSYAANCSHRLEFSVELRSTLAIARSLTSDFVPDGQLATEHLLLGLLHADDEVSRWLREQGLNPAAVETTVHHLYGHTAGPLPVAADDSWDAPLEEPPSEETTTPTEQPGKVTATAPLVPPATSGPHAPHLHPPAEIGVLRILDAAANRAREGLRVIEDYARFVLDDRLLCEQCKTLRHALSAALAELPLNQLIAARETLRDVGTTVTTSAEQTRQDPQHVVRASLKRLQESLRSLEEYGKLFSTELATQLEQLRYRSYTLERIFVIGEESRRKLAHAQLYVLLPGLASETAFKSLVEQLIAAGVDVLQLRDKQLADRELLSRAHLLRELTRDTETLCIINDRPDIARLSQADGVHVGQDELNVKEVRGIVGPSSLVGVSTHSLAQARAAVIAGADYIGVGPTFASGTKQFSEFTGTKLLKEVAAEIRLPAFAIGGITAENLPQVRQTGMQRVAVSGTVLSSKDPAAAAKELKRVLLSRL